MKLWRVAIYGAAPGSDTEPNRADLRKTVEVPAESGGAATRFAVEEYVLEHPNAGRVVAELAT